VRDEKYRSVELRDVSAWLAPEICRCVLGGGMVKDVVARDRRMRCDHVGPHGRCLKPKRWSDRLMRMDYDETMRCESIISFDLAKREGSEI
jgi:hypothetical protein